MTTDRPISSREHGAVAVMVAILSVVLFGLAAFAVDFGLAYNSKRDLQKGADAAALAAAGEIVKRGGTAASCHSIVTRWNTDLTFRNAVTGVADSYSGKNRTGATRADMQVRCSTDGKRVEVLYAAAGETPGLFGGVLGGPASIATERQAVADLFVPETVTGLRPYFICALSLTALKSTDSFIRIQYPPEDPELLAQCGRYAGNWYTTDCPLDGNNGTLAANTRNGCLPEIGIIGNAGEATQAEVLAECSDLASRPAPYRCLTSNPGNVVAQPVVDAWDYLMSLDGIAVPVFNRDWKQWADTGAADCQAGGVGNNGCFPIEAIASVKVCGYKWNNKDGTDPEEAVIGSPCTGVAADLASLPKDNNNYLWLKLTNVQTSGTTKPAECALGSGCDGGVRSTRLVE